MKSGLIIKNKYPGDFTNIGHKTIKKTNFQRVIAMGSYEENKPEPT